MTVAVLAPPPGVDPEEPAARLLQSPSATRGLGAGDLAVLALFAPLGWGSDEVRRRAVRRRAARAAPPDRVPAP